ncbi:MAG: AAA family ATPase [Candidatus Thiodiazotropha lotti]|nr:AAA family ATPase [Candidatus Thiodiazotropha lotti]MCW4220691.1 AAA family ATPase [Candidatus Thiodiazotropha lotti]
MAGDMRDLARQNQLVAQLLAHPECFGHGVERVEHIETHISHLLLIGDFVYKIKKPLNLGFLDYSTLERRQLCCAEELRLNQRFAPQLYLGVVAIRGSVEQPEIGGQREVQEFALKMARFRQQDLFDRLTLDPPLVDRLALMIADFHRRADRASELPQGGVEKVIAPMMENFRVIRALKQPLLEIERLNPLQTWTEYQAEQLAELIEERYLGGSIRECHGDLHLGNIVLYQQRITPFDGIEFNPDLRWIDTLSDIAFLLMDLQHRGLYALSDQLLNRYLEATGDYAGLPLLRFYLLYRAMVRAKVSAIRVCQADLSPADQMATLEEYLSYLSLAEKLVCHPPASLVITYGLSGSGKSTVSGQLAEQLMAIRIRSDVERKRLFPPPEGAAVDTASDRYSSEATKTTYHHLAGLARGLLQAGFSVIIDATFLKGWQRSPIHQLANRLQVPLLILDCHASPAQLCERIIARRDQGGDASEADLSVLELQQRVAEPLTEEECQLAITVDTENFPPHGFLATVLQRLMR